MSEPYPYYPLVNAATLSMVGSFLLKRKRYYYSDSLALVSAIQPPMVVHGDFPESLNAGCVIAVNHSRRPGLRSMWIRLAISGTVPHPVQWTMTSAWRYPDFFRSMIITPLPSWFLRRIANSYGFIVLPPIPPHPQETEAQAGARRSLLLYAWSNSCPIIAIALEGMETGQGCPSTPTDGIGRLLCLLLEGGLSLLACGLFEEEGYLHLQYGEPLQLSIDVLSRQDREDVLVSVTMRAIAACLPDRLRVPFA